MKALTVAPQSTMIDDFHQKEQNGVSMFDDIDANVQLRAHFQLKGIETVVSKLHQRCVSLP